MQFGLLRMRNVSLCFRSKLPSNSAVIIAIFSAIFLGAIANAQSRVAEDAQTAPFTSMRRPAMRSTPSIPTAPWAVPSMFCRMSGIDKVYTPHIIQESLSAGWGPITYRNNSELRMAAWHWTENGTWSDPAHKSGYFTGSTELKEPMRYILSYALPHRGFSTSGDRPLQGPNLSYWKSNPYLTSKFTGESDALHPQWVVVDLKAEKPVSAVRIAWANPYATTYQVEYWVGKRALDFDEGPQGEWKTFPLGRD